MASWPTNVKTFLQHLNYTENVDAAHVNDLQDEVNAMQVNLGAMPHQGNNLLGQATTYATVKARLDAYIAGIISHAHTAADGTAKLLQANTHQTPDTDSGASSLHHTLGTGATQAATGTHTHTGIPTSSVTGLDTALLSLVPAGVVVPYVAAAAPTGWLLCDGTTKVRATYPALFAVIGTTFNVGGEAGTDFRLPNVLGRTVVGAGSGSGLTARTMHQPTTAVADGEEKHILTTAELATHSHANTADNTTATHTHNVNHGHTASADSPGDHTHGLPLDATYYQRWSSGTQIPAGATQQDPSLANWRPPSGGAGAHGHTITVNANNFNSGNDSGQHGHTMTNASTGSGTAFNLMSPFTVLNFIIKT